MPSFETYVTNGILANNPFGIEKVIDIHLLHSRFFDQEEYSSIQTLIKDGNVQAIKSLPENSSDTRDFLVVVTFKDQNNKSYFVTVFDPEELWQNPEIIEIFALNESSQR